jgi:alpha-L-rhamnosidase
LKKTTKLPGNAKWIGDCRRATKGEPPCPYLRNSFALPGPVRHATLQWTALGVADVFLNGGKVGEDFLMPGWSDFRHRAQVMSADVTAMLRPGDNTLGAILGDGTGNRVGHASVQGLAILAGGVRLAPGASFFCRHGLA